MQLVIDIGNSNTKTGLFDNENLKQHFTTDGIISKSLLKKIVAKKKIDAVIVSSVRSDSHKLENFISKSYHTLLFSSQTKLQFKSFYKTPSTLGNDRKANIAAAIKLFPGNDVLVIDAGTCLKFDFADKNKKYHGGSIAPGLEMRFKALHKFTAKLPLIKPKEFKKLIGQSTEESILAGVQRGMINEVAETIALYEKKFPGVNIILTGGDLRLFAGHIKKHIFADPFLTLKGLHDILDYNT